MDITRNYIFLIVSCCFWCASLHAQNDRLHDFHYDVQVSIRENHSLLKMVSQILSKSELSETIDDLRLVTEKDKPVRHMRILKERIREAIKTINRKAHMLGFFNSKTDYRIQKISSKKVNVKLIVVPGPMFSLKVNVKYNRTGDFSVSMQKTKTRAKTSNASIVSMSKLAQLALNDLQEIGFFNPQLVRQRVQVNYQKKFAMLLLDIQPGARVTFGESSIKAFKGIDKKFLRRRLQWNEGELFDIRKVHATADILRSTQIFSKIEIHPVESGYITKQNQEEPAIDGEIPMEIILEEDKKHMVDISVLYAGIRNMNFEKSSRMQKDLKSIVARLSWTRFNAFNHGEQLKIAVEGTPMKAKSKRADYAFELMLQQPDVYFRNNTANYEISKRQELTNAYFRKIDKYELIYSYPLLKNILIRAGISLSSTYVDSNSVLMLDKEDKRYKAITCPLELILDRTNDILNPTSGYRISIKLRETLFSGLNIKHLSGTETCISYILPLDNAQKNIVAFNVLYKQLFKAKLHEIPVDKRIYCGGINSVRGYAHQMATEMYRDIECPAGGKSAVEFNFEIRRRFSQDFGGVLFFDGAKTFKNELQGLSIEKKRWFFSSGFGIRYFTSIGPIRFDFAFPIHRRRDIDSKMQFTMSLGQTF